MKSLKILTYCGLWMFLAVACNGHLEDYATSEETVAYSSGKEEAPASEQEAQALTTTARMNLENQSGRKFVRTANLEFKVENVQRATLEIEDLTARYEGFVAHTHLYTQMTRTETNPISQDSLLQREYYRVENDMTLRVPNHHLDSLLRALQPLVSFLHHRTIEAEDVSFQLLANQWRSQRMDQSQNRYVQAIGEKGEKLNDISQAEDRLLDKQISSDQARLQNLKLEDQVAYSTIQLKFYQHEEVHQELLPRYQSVEAFRPAFGVRAWEAISLGATALREFVLVLLKIWPLWLILGLGFLGYQTYWKKGEK